ncbi:LysR family transcriptional regulator [Marinomonas ostreistagni]|uniref:LysR family transcriptional regulator n=1 Tax=Marinomonas ostreistagni TaxID=359209 RepID=A0ABS0ZGG6_9GAMM|nr:LysR family transcriptional regulator [Marinomonas ostreistagni]MBJ7552543.1 LysR family transcriptional regulator [Marinomonas ostreistagni]
MLENIELQWLLSFQKVYEQLSFKRAAELLQLPKSNISRHVALLEQALNTRLLERTTRKMVATDAGDRLYHGLAPLLIAMGDVLLEARQEADVIAGHLKVITPDLPFMADAMADFCYQNPNIQLSCDTQLNPEEGLLEGFDLLIRFGRGSIADSGWVARELVRWPSCVVATPSLMTYHTTPISIAELAKLPCITSLSVLQGMPWRFKQAGSVNVSSCYKVNSGYMAKAAALKGLGFAILPLESCRQELADGTLMKVCLLEDEPEDLVLYALYSGRKYSLAKVKAFLGHVQAVIERHYA